MPGGVARAARGQAGVVAGPADDALVVPFGEPADLQASVCGCWLCRVLNGGGGHSFSFQNGMLCSTHRLISDSQTDLVIFARYGIRIRIMTFIERNGLIRYPGVNLRLGMCELCPPKSTVLDHCHEHGWIRGELCASHNGRMRLIDAGDGQCGWEPWMLEHWLRCPECAATQARELPQQPKLLSEEETREFWARLCNPFGYGSC